ncbi:YibE/F family protein [Brachybacterium sp. AOP43-C2-M15]|uniref:YibE/F family protein n=1 Tax=Brachybacterium sp. AOP43-C2-M15 TaxID=3457661 RepID=UPI0040340678
MLTVLLLLATAIGVLLLWPGPGTETESSEFLAPGVEIVPVTVTAAADPADLAEIEGSEDPADAAGLEGMVVVEAVGRAAPIKDVTVSVEVPPEVAADGLHVGDRIRVLSVAEAGGEESSGEESSGEQAGPGQVMYYFDHDRSLPLGLLLVAYLLLVALVARGSGLRAMAGLAAGVAIVLWFMLPAIFAGENAILVALVAASAMIFPCVYFAHGISVRTTTAVLGTFGGVAVTVVIAMAAGRPTGMTGADGEAAQILYSTHPHLSLPAVFLAGVIISGLGALNDVTITQASSAWELRAAMPEASRLEVFTATMRIGRDHIASTVYTLAYAYIGSALPLLMYASTINRSLMDTLTSGEIAAEIFRTLIASIGLVLAIPLTTAIAALLASRPTERRSRRQQLQERLARF